jgi:biopolymer transport protein ExbD
VNTDNSTVPSIPLHPVVFFAVINLFFLILAVLIFCSSFSKPAGFEIRIPRAIMSENLQNDQTISITAENVLYLNSKVVTLNELKRELTKIDNKAQNISLQVNRRSSMGRVMDVWDLCQALGNSHVHIVTGQEN